MQQSREVGSSCTAGNHYKPDIPHSCCTSPEPSGEPGRAERSLNATVPSGGKRKTAKPTSVLALRQGEDASARLARAGDPPTQQRLRWSSSISSCLRILDQLEHCRDFVERSRI